MKWLYYSCLSVYLQLQNDSSAYASFSEKSLKLSGGLCSIHAQVSQYAPLSLSVSIHVHLPLWARVDIR